MEFLTTNINDIIGYILLSVIYFFSFLTNRQNRMNSMLFKNDMTKKVEMTKESVQTGIDNAQIKANDVERRLLILQENTKKEVDELHNELTKERAENKKLRDEFVRSVRHSEELCKRGVAKQIVDNLREENKK